MEQFKYTIPLELVAKLGVFNGFFLSHSANYSVLKSKTCPFSGVNTRTKLMSAANLSI